MIKVTIIEPDITDKENQENLEKAIEVLTLIAEKESRKYAQNVINTRLKRSFML